MQSEGGLQDLSFAMVRPKVTQPWALPVYTQGTKVIFYAQVGQIRQNITAYRISPEEDIFPTGTAAAC